MSRRKHPQKVPANGKDLAQRVYEGLCEEITTGKLKPGELLSRRQIARRYGASYTPVVEAMVRLEHSGLIEAEPAQMSRVQRLSLDTIRGQYVLREACETQAIRLACESATDQEIAELYQLAKRVDSRTRDAHMRQRKTQDGDLSIIHWQFHKRIAELSRYGILLREMERIGMWELMRRLAFAHLLRPYPPRHHERLVDALNSRDAEQADAVMRAHIREGLENEIRAYHQRIKG